MAVTGRSRVYSENITKLLPVNIRQADSFNLMPLTSLWVNESDLESDFPYHGGGEKIRMEWEEKMFLESSHCRSMLWPREINHISRR